MPQFPFYSYPKGDIPESIRSTVFSFLHYDTYCSSLFNPLRYARIIGTGTLVHSSGPVNLSL